MIIFSALFLWYFHSNKESSIADTIVHAARKQVAVTMETRNETISSHKSTSQHAHYPINCSNIHKVVLGEKLGQGRYRVTYSGVFNGQDVAVKIVTPAVAYVKNCILVKEKAKLSKLPNARYEEDCFKKPNMLMLKEIGFLGELDHSGIIKLFGFCERNETSPYNPNPINHGIVSVFERASSKLKVEHMQAMSLETRLQTALQLTDLLNYMQNSPLGSLVHNDMHTSNYMIFQGQMKISDLDAMSTSEVQCRKEMEPCLFNITCQNGMCVGENAATNMNKATEVFFKQLLSCSNNCGNVENEIKTLYNNMTEKVMKAETVKDIIISIQRKLHLESTSIK